MKKKQRHGLRNTKVYSTWNKINMRCYNENDVGYRLYGAKGITFDYRHDFIGFFNEVGHPPTNKHSIDRIDNSLGYIKGNMKWSTLEEQARNKGKNSNNSSGVTGVYWDADKNGSTRTRAIWVDLNGKVRSKSFAVNNYGLLPAFAEAVRYRNRMIDMLNLQGAGYSEKHGK